MKKIYLIPNFVTTLNLMFGFYSITESFNHHILQAAWAIVAAGVCDLLDGRIARLAKATSQFGVEYDSLSDLLSFGAAPAVLMYVWCLSIHGRLGWLIAFLFLACGALRLARFNVTTTRLPKGAFQGLPIPAAAGMIASIAIVIFSTPEIQWIPMESWGLWITGGLGLLMISSIAFPSFKELNWKSRASFGYWLAGFLVIISVALKPEWALFGIGFAYLVASCVLWGAQIARRRKS